MSLGSRDEAFARLRKWLPNGGAWSLPYYTHLGIIDPQQPLFVHTAGTADPVAQVHCAAALGFSGLEDNFLAVRPEIDQRRIGEALADTGLAMGCFVFGFESRKQPLWNSVGAEAEALLALEMERCLAAAERTRARYVTLVTGSDPLEDHDRQIDRYIANLKRYAPVAADAGLILCMEAHAPSRVPGMIFRSLREAHRVAAEVAHPSVKLVFDVAHAELSEGDESVIDSYRACADQVAVFQMADMPGRVEVGAGTIDYVGLLRTAKALGFAGPYELECNISEPGVEGEQKALGLLAEIDALCDPVRILTPGRS